MHRRLVAAATVVTLLVIGLVVRRAANAPAPRLARAATTEERERYASAIRTAESNWHASANREFPRDAWSHSDDFHGQEMNLARELARRDGVRTEDVLRAVDDDLHREGAHASSPDRRSARAIPCKPRPFYD